MTRDHILNYPLLNHLEAGLDYQSNVSKKFKDTIRIIMDSFNI